MDKLFSLDNRLSLCAEFVRKGSRVTDVGSDHAYLPVWLAKNGYIQSAIAVDIRPLPLKKGEENIQKYKCSDMVTVRLSDGLTEIKQEETDDIVMAGMGGELIADIISRAPWLRNKRFHLILQPMTRGHILRRYLNDNGYIIQKEKACTEKGKNYSVMSVYYKGIVQEKDEMFYYIGMLDEKDETSYPYIKDVLKKLCYKADGKRHNNEDSTELDTLINAIKNKFGVDNNDNG
ncbi:MAG: SAM-dependent methyltransferase [Clostridia bacterium]|nr:SAM-dependent methyltransferase [Clostridia bacterium]